MIAVLADDFTGAAELGAIGLSFGLTTEVQTAFYPETKAELIVIDTHTRSPQKTIRKIKSEIEKIQKANPLFVYKKVDSVLRGSVITELETVMEVLGKKRALLVAANPSAGRKIRDGQYFIRNLPLHKTDFARDPDFPALTSDVLVLLGPSSLVPVRSYSFTQKKPVEGILVPDVTNKSDLKEIANLADDRTVLAGAADFFRSLLVTYGYKLVDATIQDTSTDYTYALFLFGSRSLYSRCTLKRAQSLRIPTLEIPIDVIQNFDKSGDMVQTWTQYAVNILRLTQKTIITMKQPESQTASLSQKFPAFLAQLAKGVLKKISTGSLHLFIEGGSTASTVIRHLGWKRLVPVQELAPGVVTLRVQKRGNQYVTTKPGSYPWPQEIL